METAQELVKNALTGASERPTRELQKNTQEWAEWFKMNLFHDPELARMVMTAAAAAMDFKEKKSPCWLSLVGVTGVGKSKCARRVWEYMKNRSDWSNSLFLPEVIYWPAFVSDLKSGCAYERVRNMRIWPVLFLDDIGADRDTTGFSTEQLNQLLGCREGKWTILTSNKSLENLAEVEPRIADRMIRPPNLFIDVNTESYSVRIKTSKG